MRVQGRPPLLIVLLSLLAAPARLTAQPLPPNAPGVPPGYEVRWHIVRPGETLRGITARYTGSQSGWQANHRLNPDIADPDLLHPGQRIRVLLPQRGAAPAAQVQRLARRVDEKPSPIPWSGAQVGDLLVEHDGLRTYASSSAEMAFTDGTRLLVTEDSLVFLQRTGGSLQGVQRQAVEIVQGQADVEARPAAGRPAAEVEIVLGNARALSRPGAAGTSQSRARRADGGGAKVMVYGGTGEVSAGGARVAVPEGMGTSVAQAGPPAPPEKLLPAPRLLSPAAGAEVACANPALAWDAVPEADSYTVEVCRDGGCGELVERATGVAATGWRAASLPKGDLFWRVTARSRSGLDGYPSTAAALAVTAEQDDLDPPTGTLRITGHHLVVGDRLFVAPDAGLTATVEDAGSGAGTWTPLIDGAERADRGEGAGRWSAGAHDIGALIADRCGNRVPLAAVALVVDDAAPTLHWRLGDARELEEKGGPLRDQEERRRRGRRAAPAPSSGLLWSAGWEGWAPLGVPGEPPVRIANERPQVFLRGAGITLRTDSGEVTLGPGQMLWIEAEDEGAGAESLTLKVKPAEGVGKVLELQTIDLVGNVRRVQWPLSGPGT